MGSKCYHILLLLILYNLLQINYARERKFSTLPLRDPLRNEEPIKKKTIRTKEQIDCSKCDHMLRLSEAEFESLKDENRYCVRLMQVSRCIRKNKNPSCHMISMMVLQYGVTFKQKKYECSKT